MRADDRVRSERGVSRETTSAKSKHEKLAEVGGPLAEVVPGSAQTHDGAPVNGKAEEGSGARLDYFRQPSFGGREWGGRA
jgi:hypothetical protein